MKLLFRGHSDALLLLIIDAEFASGKQFEAAMGEDGIKKLEQLEAACVESSKHNLFVIDPR
jgi:hypothetical protein